MSLTPYQPVARRKTYSRETDARLVGCPGVLHFHVKQWSGAQLQPDWLAASV